MFLYSLRCLLRKGLCLLIVVLRQQIIGRERLLPTYFDLIWDNENPSFVHILVLLWRYADVFATCAAALDCVLFYLAARGLPMTADHSNCSIGCRDLCWRCSRYQVATAAGLHFLCCSMYRQLLKATQSCQESTPAGLLLWQRIAHTRLRNGIVEFSAYLGQAYLLKWRIGSTSRELLWLLFLVRSLEEALLAWLARTDA